MAHTELRRQDFSLADYQKMIAESFGDLFRNECPTSLVRSAEPIGYAPTLWQRVVDTGVTEMALPESAGGAGSTLVDLAIVAQEAGAVLAPIPLVSHLAATRLMARLPAPRTLLDAAVIGGRKFTLALRSTDIADRQLVPDAAIASDVIAFDGHELSLFTSLRPSSHVANQGNTPLGWWMPDASQTRTVLATGPDAAKAFGRACAEWKVLMAATLVGLSRSALRIAVEFAKSRRTMGVSIATLQGVSFPLADVAIGISGAANLVWKSAWFLEESPDERPELPMVAHAYARRVAGSGVSTCVRVQGGLGVSNEADATLFFTRARSWGALAGSIADDYVAIARHWATRV